MPRQLPLDLFSDPSGATHAPAIAAAIAQLAAHGDDEARGAVFRRGEVGKFILDLVGYTVDQPRHRQRLLERSSIGRRFRNDTERLEKLFELYPKMTANAANCRPAKKGSRGEKA